MVPAFKWVQILINFGFKELIAELLHALGPDLKLNFSWIILCAQSMCLCSMYFWCKKSTWYHNYNVESNHAKENNQSPIARLMQFIWNLPKRHDIKREPRRWKKSIDFDESLFLRHSHATNHLISCIICISVSNFIRFVRDFFFPFSVINSFIPFDANIFN